MSRVHPTDAVPTETAVFDSVAADYDRSFDSDPATRRARGELHALISTLAPSGGRLLDIACGTGTDAIALSEMGFDVVGVDASHEMITRARTKVATTGTTPPRFAPGRVETLSSSVDGTFDLAYSNFGGFNCVDDLNGVAEQLAGLLRPGGYVVIVVMPRVSPWEILAGMAKFRPSHAVRRFVPRPVATGPTLPRFPVTYHSIRTLKRAFGHGFRVVYVRGLNILTPPPGQSAFGQRYPRVYRVLSRLETPLSSLPVIRTMGDHVLVVMQRNTSPVRE